MQSVSISIADLRQALDIALSGFEQVHGQRLRLDDEMCWHLPADERTNPLARPTSLTLTTTGDRVDVMRRLLRAPEDVLVYDLSVLGELLRTLGDLGEGGTAPAELDP